MVDQSNSQAQQRKTQQRKTQPEASLPGEEQPSENLPSEKQASATRAPLIRRSLLNALIVVLLCVSGMALFWDDIQSWRTQTHVEELFRTYRDGEALAWLREKLLAAPGDPAVAVQLVRVHRRLGNLDKALMLADAAEKLGVPTAELELDRRLIAVQSGQIRGFDKEFSRLIVDRADRGPDIFQAYVLGLFANLRTDEALNLLAGWKQSSPDDPQPSFLQAYLFQSINQLPSSIEAYRAGLKLAPQTTLMRRRLAAVLLESGEIAAARQELLTCQNQEPNDIEVSALLAQCDFAENDLGGALAHLDRVLEVNPAHPEARRLRGQIRLASKDARAALEDLQAVIQMQPDDTVAREALGRALQQTGRAEEAKQQFEQVARATKQEAETVRLIRQVIDNPNDAELRFTIGQKLLEAGSIVDGLKWLRTVLEIDPNHAGARAALARQVSQSQQPTQSKTEQQP